MRPTTPTTTTTTTGRRIPVVKPIPIPIRMPAAAAATMDGVFDCPMSSYGKGYNSWYYREHYHHGNVRVEGNEKVAPLRSNTRLPLQRPRRPPLLLLLLPQQQRCLMMYHQTLNHRTTSPSIIRKSSMMMMMRATMIWMTRIRNRQRPANPGFPVGSERRRNHLHRRRCRCNTRMATKQMNRRAAIQVPPVNPTTTRTATTVVWIITIPRGLMMRPVRSIHSKTLF